MSISQLNNQTATELSYLNCTPLYLISCWVFFFFLQILAPTTGSPTQEPVLYRVLYIRFLAFPLIKMYA